MCQIYGKIPSSPHAFWLFDVIFYLSSDWKKEPTRNITHIKSGDNDTLLASYRKRAKMLNEIHTNQPVQFIKMSSINKRIYTYGC